MDKELIAHLIITIYNLTKNQKNTILYSLDERKYYNYNAEIQNKNVQCYDYQRKSYVIGNKISLYDCKTNSTFYIKSKTEKEFILTNSKINYSIIIENNNYIFAYDLKNKKSYVIY